MVPTCATKGIRELSVHCAERRTQESRQGLQGPAQALSLVVLSLFTTSTDGMNRFKEGGATPVVWSRLHNTGNPSCLAKLTRRSIELSAGGQDDQCAQPPCASVRLSETRSAQVRRGPQVCASPSSGVPLRNFGSPLTT